MDLIETLYQRQLESDPTFASLVNSGDISHGRSAQKFIRLCIENVEEKIGMFTRLYSTAWSKGDNSVNDLSAQCQCVEQYSMQCFKERATVLRQDEMVLITDNYQVSVGAHRLVLRKHHHDLVHGLELVSSTLLDELVANHLMEDSDVKSIVANTTSKSRAEAFLRRVHLSFSGQTFLDSFLPILSKYNGEVAKQLTFSLQNISLVPDFSKCYNCQMKATVEPALLADVLFSNWIIDPNLHHDLRNDSISNKEKWERLSTEVEDPRDIIEVLRLKYPMVYEEFDMANAPSFSCWCDLIITRPKPAISSYEDASDVANLADLESVLEEADGDIARDDISVLTEAWSEVAEHVKKTQGEGTPSDCQLNAKDKNSRLQNQSVEEPSGATSLAQASSIEIIYDRDTTESPKNKGFKQTIKNFLAKHLYSRFTSHIPTLPARPAREYDYDAFIMYGDDGSRLVHGAVRRLEDYHDLTLCIHDRDFLPGRLITDNIMSALRKSKALVAIISPSFLKSEWCMFEYHMAIQMNIEENAKLIFIKYGDLRFDDKMPKSLSRSLWRGDFLDWNIHDPNSDITLRDLVKAIND